MSWAFRDSVEKQWVKNAKIDMWRTECSNISQLLIVEDTNLGYLFTLLDSYSLFVSSFLTVSILKLSCMVSELLFRITVEAAESR
jgi:hypothetical protein